MHYEFYHDQSIEKMFGDIKVEVSVGDQFSYDFGDDCFTTFLDVTCTRNGVECYLSGWADFYRNEFFYDAISNGFSDEDFEEIDDPDWWDTIDIEPLIDELLKSTHQNILDKFPKE